MAMTRETKIGLLVGLAFIILFGIILSEKGSERNDKFSTPPAIKPLVELVPPTSIPQSQVATIGKGDDVVGTKMTMSDPEVKVIEKIVPPGPSNIVIKQGEDRQSPQIAEQPELSPKLKEMLPPTPKRAVSQIPASNPNPSAEELLKPLSETGEPVQVADASPVSTQTPADVEKTAELPSTVKTHVVSQGETLVSICRQYYPADQVYSKCKEVMKLNGIDKPERMRAGQSIKIPGVLEQVVSAAGTKNMETAKSGLASTGLLVPVKDQTLVGVVNPDKSKVNLNVKESLETKTLQTYTVQSKDTLGKIAKRFYGSEKAWTRIYEMNKSVLKDPHVLRTGQNLKVPVSSELAAVPKVD
jgi:nucleoid-associated protein YgaU